MLYFPGWKILAILAVLCAGALLAVPNALPERLRDTLAFVGLNRTVNLGLDLRGGSHLLLEVELDAALTQRMEGVRDEVRKILREKRIGYRGLRIQGAQVRLQLRDPAQGAQAKAALEEISDPLGIDFLSPFAADSLRVEIAENGAAALLPSEDARRRSAQRTLAQSIEIVRRRVDELGTTEPTIQRQGSERILVQVPGFDDPERLKNLLGQTAKLNFQLVDTSMSAAEALAAAPPAGSLILYGPGEPAPSYLIRRRIMVSGENLVDAQPAFDQINNAPIVTFQLDSLGARRFGETTRQNVGKPFAIVLDGKVVSAPVIREPILGGRAQISGNFSIQEAGDLAILLRAGALPAPLRILEERTVGPSLGADSVRAGTLAALIGLAAVIGFILLSYGLFGLFANLALLVNLVLILGVLSLLQATLTLPGIAGIVLTIGMAVDANVLIFERIREEAGRGKSLINAIDAGYSRALGTILDANITTFIAAAILFFAGSGPVRGFAVTLGIGIITSVFTAFTFTRLLAASWVRLRRPARLPFKPAPLIATPENNA